MHEAIKYKPVDNVPHFETKIARSSEDIEAGQRLRYAVFIEEMGGNGPLVDHHSRLERDDFDSYADQLLLKDLTRPEGDQVVGVYRLLDQNGAEKAGGYYSQAEYDLSQLERNDRPMVELGRSCLHQDYRGGAAMVPLWQALAREVESRGAEILFGVASFHGTDLNALAAPLSLLHRDHLAPPELCATSRDKACLPPCEEIDRLSTLRQVPALIKAYLRLGGYVGDGAYVDHAFNTTDVFLILDSLAMNPRQRAIYGATLGRTS